MGGSISVTHAFNKYACCFPFCSLVLLMYEMSAGIPCTPLVIPGETKQSEPTVAYLCFLVPVASDHYGCLQHILNEKRQLFLQMAIIR